MSDDERVDREIDDLLRTLDHDPPRVTPQDVMRRARRPRAAAVRIAAGVVAVLALAGVAYALPGSPVRSWVRSLGERPLHNPVGEPSRAPAGTPDGDPGRASGEALGGAGLVFDPAEPLTIRIAAGSSGHVRVSPTTRPRLVVRMVTGGGRFTSDPSELAVRLTAPDTLELLVPRSARSIAITFQGTRLFTQRGEDRSSVSTPDSAGRFRFDLPSGPP